MILKIHRGSKQIGGSCIEIRADTGERILLDMGMPLTPVRRKRLAARHHESPEPGAS